MDRKIQNKKISPISCSSSKQFSRSPSNSKVISIAEMKNNKKSMEARSRVIENARKLDW